MALAQGDSQILMFFKRACEKGFISREICIFARCSAGEEGGAVWQEVINKTADLSTVFAIFPRFSR